MPGMPWHLQLALRLVSHCQVLLALLEGLREQQPGEHVEWKPRAHVERKARAHVEWKARAHDLAAALHK